MSDEIEIKVGEDSNKDDHVTIVENDGETIVDVSPKKKEETQQSEDPRWAAAQAENMRLQSQLAQIQSQIVGNQGNQRSNADPYQQELDNISAQERALGIEWETKRASKQLTQDAIDTYDRKARDFSQQRANIAARKAINEAMPQLVQYQQRAHFQTKHADVHANLGALEYAKGTYQQLRAMGHAESEALVDQAMNEARRQFGLSGVTKFAPTEHEKRQLMGMSASGGRQVADNTVKMGKAEKAMAMAMYGEHFNGDEKKVYSHWAKKIGIKAKRAHEKAVKQAR